LGVTEFENTFLCFFLCNISKLCLKAGKKEEAGLLFCNYAVCSFSDKTATPWKRWGVQEQDFCLTI